jgi:hypothetical protein
MHSGFRAAFNAAFTLALASRYARDLARRAGCEPSFRLAETPVFLTKELAAALEDGARAIVAQLSKPEALLRMKKAIPTRWAAPGMDPLPSLAQVDFAIVMGADGHLVPRLIELQGFPSLSAFEVLQSDAWNEALSGVDGLPKATWSPYFSGLSRSGFLALFSRTLVGDEDPEEVVLLDLDPPEQKTAIDFSATRSLLGVDAVDPRSLVKEAKRLFRVKNGRRIPVKRIYNRIVFDELIKRDLELPFDFREDLDVRWVPHPNWYWTWSKYSLPLLTHETVPKATYLSELDVIPRDLTERYVLKPLFSFAGGGVNVDPTPADFARIPEGERGSWCLQEKIAYDPCLLAVDGGGVKVEVRMMFFRPDADEAPTLGLNLCRLSRGKMLGVDFNKDFTWVGSSVALQPGASTSSAPGGP